MLRLALGTLVSRKGGALGALAAVGLAVVLVVSCGILLESSLRASTPVERLQGASVVVQGEPAVHPSGGEANLPVTLPERRRLDESLAGRIRPIPGVERVVADRTVYARLVDGRAALHTVGHGWASTAVTPYRLTDGHAPRTAGEVVVARASRFHAGDRVRVLTAEGSQWFAVSGTAHGPAPAVFFRDDVAAMLSADARHADLLAIVTRPRADAEQVADRVRAALHDSHVRVLTGAKRGDAESPDDVVSRDD